MTVGGQDQQDSLYHDSPRHQSQFTGFTSGRQSNKSFHSEPSRYLRVSGAGHRASASASSFQPYNNNNNRLTVCSVLVLVICSVDHHIYV